MENLKPFEDVIHEHVSDDKPFLGIYGSASVDDIK